MPSRPSTAAGSRAPPKSLEVKGKGGQPVHTKIDKTSIPYFDFFVSKIIFFMCKKMFCKVASKSSLSRLERLKRHQEIIRRCTSSLFKQKHIQIGNNGNILFLMCSKFVVLFRFE